LAATSSTGRGWTRGNCARSSATAFARKVATGPTRAYAAHKALLRAWAVGGVSAADEAMFKTGLASAVKAFKAELPRPAAVGYQGH
jgi:hypothetical protein